MILEQCCCFELRTGSFIIGCLSWIGTLSKIFGGFYGGDIPSDFSRPSGAFFIFKIIVGVMILVICGAMLMGVYQEYSPWIRPWLIIAFVECVLTTILSILMFVFIFTKSDTSYYLGFFFFLLVLGALNWYFWLVVYSYYTLLVEDEE